MISDFVNFPYVCVIIQEMLERLEIAALLITAVIHDLDHPGRTNPHLCNTRHNLAILYNDRYTVHVEPLNYTQHFS